MIEVTNETFDQEVLQANKVVLVDFWADWCAPCRMLTPILEELSSEQHDGIKIVKLDTEANPGKREEYNILAIPTMLLFKNGELVDGIVGVMPKSIILHKLLQHV